MATDLGRHKSASTAEYENRVQDQLGRAEKRIRTLDLAAALLTFAAGTLAYAVVAVVLDRWLILSPGVRQAGLVVYLLAAAAYLTAFVVLPLSRRINPYFAARQLEQTLPDAKNSVVNWLDLREANLPPAIRGAVGQRAAKVVAGADPEKAVSGRRAWTAGGLAAICAVAFVVALFLFGFRPFLGFLGRTFAPFGANDTNALPTATQIRVVKPAEGNAVVTGDRPLEILVRVDGRVPDPKADDALMLHFRYSPSAPYDRRPLEADDGGRWGVSLPAVDVKDGFWYKVTGGDAETPEYRVRLTPRVLDFKAVYTFRPYTARAKETHLERKIEALRGTQVDVTVHTNRDVKDGWLQFDGANGATVTHGEPLPADPQAFAVRLTLDESSQYRICFTSAEGENFTEAQSFPLIAVPDKPPVVTLTQPVEQKDKPGWVPPLQADGLLQLEGVVTDDVGVAEMGLNLRVDNGPTLPRQEYRSPKELQLQHGGNPTRVDYKDFVDLTKLKSTDDPLFTVRPGMVLEYWLTAEDACDYPNPNKPNVGESKHYRVQIVEPMNNPPVANQQRAQAANDKQQNDQKQDQKNQAQDQKNQDDNKQKEQSNQSGGDGKSNPKNDGDKGNDHQDAGNPQPKPGDSSKPGMGEDKPNDKPQDGGKPGDSGKPNPAAGGQENNPNPDQGNTEADKKKEQQRIKDAIDKIRKDQEGSGKNDAQQHPAEAKDGGQQPKPQPPADAKDGGGKEGTKDASQPKDGPQNKPGDRHDEAAAKDQGRPDPNQPQQGEAKPGGDPKAGQDAKPGESKDGKAEAAPEPGESKDGGKPDDQKQAGGEKPPPDGAADKTPKAENKEGNPPNPMGDAGPAGQAKDKAPAETKAEPKPGMDPADQNAPKSEGKGDGAKDPMDGAKEASAKDGGDNTPPKEAAKPKPEAGSEGNPPPDEKAKNLDDAMKQLQDDLKSKEPQKREMAEEFIRRYMMNADNPQIRDRAKRRWRTLDSTRTSGPSPPASRRMGGTSRRRRRRRRRPRANRGLARTRRRRRRTTPRTIRKTRRANRRATAKRRSSRRRRPRRRRTGWATASRAVTTAIQTTRRTRPSRRRRWRSRRRCSSCTTSGSVCPRTSSRTCWPIRISGGCWSRPRPTARKTWRACSTAARSTARSARPATRTAWGRPTTPTTAAAPSRRPATASRTRSSPSCCRPAAIGSKEPSGASRRACPGGINPPARPAVRAGRIPMTFPLRYLVRFGPKQTTHVFTDVLVIGGGIAGLRAALAAPPDMQVLVVTKDRVQQSNSTYAQGGIAAVLLAGRPLREPHRGHAHGRGRPVRPRRGGPGGPRGARLHRRPDPLRRPLRRRDRHGRRPQPPPHRPRPGRRHRMGGDAGRHRPRPQGGERLHLGPHIHHRPADARRPLRRRPGAARPARPPAALGQADDPGQRRRRHGLPRNDQPAGGDRRRHGRRLSGRRRAPRHGVHAVPSDDPLCRRFQPHPHQRGGARRGRLPARPERRPLHAGGGPARELATRDVVARAIVRRMEKTQHPNVYLDLSHLDPAKVRAHFPGIDKVCREFGLDITTDQIPVRPGAHYMVGGVTVDLQGRTTLPGLWAAGEVSSSGLHGANRLASNSLLEGLVFGTACGRGAAAEAARMPDVFAAPPVQSGFTPESGGPRLDVADVTNALRSLMVRNMGIVRDRAGLVEAEKQVAFWCRYVLRREFATRAGWELQNLLTVARLMIWSALQRTESRGVHYRADHPERDDAHWLKHVVCPAQLPVPPTGRG